MPRTPEMGLCRIHSVPPEFKPGERMRLNTTWGLFAFTMPDVTNGAEIDVTVPKPTRSPCTGWGPGPVPLFISLRRFDAAPVAPAATRAAARAAALAAPFPAAAAAPAAAPAPSPIDRLRLASLGAAPSSDEDDETPTVTGTRSWKERDDALRKQAILIDDSDDEDAPLSRRASAARIIAKRRLKRSARKAKRRVRDVGVQCGGGPL